MLCVNIYLVLTYEFPQFHLEPKEHLRSILRGISSRPRRYQLKGNKYQLVDKLINFTMDYLLRYARTNLLIGNYLFCLNVIACSLIVGVISGVNLHFFSPPPSL